MELGRKLCPMGLSQAAASAEQMVFPGFEGTWFLSGTQKKYTEEDLAWWVGSVALSPCPQRDVSALCWPMGPLMLLLLLTSCQVSKNNLCPALKHADEELCGCACLWDSTYQHTGHFHYPKNSHMPSAPQSIPTLNLRGNHFLPWLCQL